MNIPSGTGDAYLDGKTELSLGTAGVVRTIKAKRPPHLLYYVTEIDSGRLPPHLLQVKTPPPYEWELFWRPVANTYVIDTTYSTTKYCAFFTGRHTTSTMSEFRPALIVVDFQEDFCPPVSSAIVSGADILLTLLEWIAGGPERQRYHFNSEQAALSPFCSQNCD